MTTEGTTFSRHIQGQHAGGKTFAGTDPFRRFRYYIEHSEWDEVMLAQEEWIDKLCIGAIVVASLYFIPTVLVMLFLR